MKKKKNIRISNPRWRKEMEKEREIFAKVNHLAETEEKIFAGGWNSQSSKV